METGTNTLKKTEVPRDFVKEAKLDEDVLREE